MQASQAAYAPFFQGSSRRSTPRLVHPSIALQRTFAGIGLDTYTVRLCHTKAIALVRHSRLQGAASLD